MEGGSGRYMLTQQWRRCTTKVLCVHLHTCVHTVPVPVVMFECLYLLYRYSTGQLNKTPGSVSQLNILLKRASLCISFFGGFASCVIFIF